MSVLVFNVVMLSHNDNDQIQVEPGKPEQFCSMMKKLGEAPLAVSPYPVAWRVEVVNDVEHRGFEYIRSEKYVALHGLGVYPRRNSFFWGTAEWAWNVDHGSKANGTKVGKPIAAEESWLT